MFGECAKIRLTMWDCFCLLHGMQAMIIWLELFDLQTLQEHRLHAINSVFCSRNYYSNDTFKAVTISNLAVTGSCNHHLQLSVPFAHTNFYRYSFVPQKTSFWNMNLFLLTMLTQFVFLITVLTIFGYAPHLLVCPMHFIFKCIK